MLLVSLIKILRLGTRNKMNLCLCVPAVVGDLWIWEEMSDSAQGTPWHQGHVFSWAFYPRDRCRLSRALTWPHNQNVELNNPLIAMAAWGTRTGRKAGRELEETGLTDWSHTA